MFLIRKGGIFPDTLLKRSHQACYIRIVSIGFLSTMPSSSYIKHIQNSTLKQRSTNWAQEDLQKGQAVIGGYSSSKSVEEVPATHILDISGQIRECHVHCFTEIIRTPTKQNSSLMVSYGNALLQYFFLSVKWNSGYR